MSIVLHLLSLVVLYSSEAHTVGNLQLFENPSSQKCFFPNVSSSTLYSKLDAEYVGLVIGINRGRMPRCINLVVACNVCCGVE